MSAPPLEDCCYGVPNDAGLYGPTSADVSGYHRFEPACEELQPATSDDYADDATEPDQAPLLDYDALREHHAYLQLLADQVYAAEMSVKAQQASIDAALDDLWDQNQDLRRKGLRGGTARKARKTNKTYTHFRDMSPDQTRRRMSVEKLDQQDRDRKVGLRILESFFHDSLAHVKHQVEECKRILGREWKTKSGNVVTLAYDVELTDNILTGDMFKSIEEAQGMMDAFHAEYCL